MKVERGDFILCKPEKKTLLCEVVKAKDGNIRAIVNDKFRYTKDAFTMLKMSSEDVIANLSKDPINGNAYSVKVEPLQKIVVRKPFGHIYFFRKLNEVDETRLYKALDKAGDRLRKLDLIEHFPIDIEIRPSKGKFSGMYYYKGGKEDTLDVMVLKPIDFSNLSYVVEHELAHHIFFRYVSNKMKAKWIDLYHKNVKLSLFDTKSINKMYIKFVDSGLEIRDFESDLDESEQTLFSSIIDYIVSTHRIDTDDINTFVKVGYRKTLKRLSPVHELQDSNVEPLVSEYGTKNVDELFAEAISFYYTNQKLPKSVKSLVKKTLNSIR